MTPLADRREALLLLAAGALGPFTAAAAAPRAGAAPEMLRKGFNLPDQVPARAEKAADVGVLKRLRDLGMTHVRLPVEAEYVLASFSGPATVSSALDDLERAMERLLGLGYCVSVDMHPGSDFQRLQRQSPDKAHSALLAGWRDLAARLARWPAKRVFAELLNEPATTDDVWRSFAERLAGEVRARLPQTTIIVGSAPYQRHEALAGWRPLADRNVVYAVHYYDPMIFTHQGAVWDKGAPWARIEGVPFPTQAGDPALARLAEVAARKGDEDVARELRDAARSAWTQATVMARLSELAAWSVAHSAPVIVNEFGVLRWKARRADRLAWIAAVRVAAEANGFGWAHWDYATSFGLLNEDGSLDQGVIHALLGG
jgi:endoglucanase